jgi:hypothetical protein
MSMRVPLVVALAAALGCAGAQNRSRVDPREFRGRPVSQASEVPIEVEGEQVAIAWLASGGAFRTQLTPGREVLHVRLTIRNLDPGPLRVPLDCVALEGVKKGERIRPLALIGHDANRASVVIEGGAMRVIDLVFPVPMTMDLEELDRFTVVWGVDVPGGIVRNETGFAVSMDDRLAGKVERAFRPY